MSLTITNISHKLEKSSCCSLVVRVLCCKSQSLGKTFVLCFTYVFNVYDIYGMVWNTQVELVIVISVLTRKFR